MVEDVDSGSDITREPCSKICAKDSKNEVSQAKCQAGQVRTASSTEPSLAMLAQSEKCVPRAH